jgi:hypothetical protein
LGVGEPDKRVIKFRFAEGTPHESRLARWFSVFCMSVNDLLLVNRWLVEGLRQETPSQNAYLGRLLSAHLFELGTFLKRTDKDHLPEIREFLGGLEPEARESLEMLKAIGEGGTSEFALQLKQARDKIFHYQRLVIGDGEEHDLIKKTLRGLARKEAKEGKALGEIEDSAPPITGFRAKFADDIAVNISFPVDLDDDEEEGELMAAYLNELLRHVLAFMPLVEAVLPQYVNTFPEGTFWLDG